jgi:hypothetical protein
MKHSLLKATSFATLTMVFAIAHASAQQAPLPPAIVGEYALTQVDKGDLPIKIAEKDGCRQEVTAAKLALTADNKYTIETTVKETCGDKVQEKNNIERGTVAAMANKITFTPEVPAQPLQPKRQPARLSPSSRN